MKKLLLGWALSLTASIALAQTPVSVTVSDDAGSLLSGISVYAFNNSTYVNKNAVTDANGVASIVLSDGNYRFRADKSGTQYFSGGSNHCSTPSCNSVAVSIPRPVEVTLSSSGGGVESGLTVYAFNGSTYINKSAVSNASGVATLQLPAGTYRFRIDKSGTQFYTGSSNHCAVPGCTSVAHEIPESVVVTVDGDFGPETGLSVYAFNDNSYVNKSAITDANGEATFTLIPGNYRFRIDKNGTQFFTSPTNHCVVASCTDVAFSMPSSVAVTVTSSAGGFEAGLNVYAFNGNTYVNKSAITDVSGGAEFTLIPGNYRFRVDKDGTQYFTDSVNHCGVPGCVAVTLEVPESVTVNVSSSGGGVESGLTVYAFNANTYINKSSVTDASGQATFTLLPGSYRFRIDKNGTQFYTDSVNHCALPGCNAVSYEIPESVIVSVTNSVGNIEAGLNVYAFDGNGYVNKSAVTDVNGQAQFTLLPGDYRFRIDKAGVQTYTDSVNHCQVPGCTFVSQQLLAPLSAYVTDAALGACLDAAGASNGWTSPSQLTSLSCNGQGVSNLAGLSSFNNLTSLSLANNPITLLGELESLSQLTLLDLTGATSLECSALGTLEGLLGTGVISHPSSCLGEGELVFSLLNPGKPATNQFSFSVATTPTGNIISSAITYNPFTDSYDGEVYLIDSTNGDELLQISNPSISGSDYFGWSVASSASGDIIVGAWNDDTSGVNSGTVYIYDGADGSLLQVISNPAPSAGDRFGYAVAGSGSGNIIVGAYEQGLGGAVHVFDYSGALLYTLSNPSTDLNAEFGKSLTVSAANEILVGAPKQDASALTDAGVVHLFAESNGSFLLSISNPSALAFDDYGSAVAVSALGDIFVSARLQDTHASNDGSLFVHDSVSGALLWSVSNPLADTDGLFASSIATTPSGEVVVGAANDDFGAPNSGRVYIYSRVDGSLIKTINNPEPEADVNFGQGLAVTPSGQIAVGAYGADGGFGKLYLFASVSSGEALTPVNETPFNDLDLQACVLGQSALNGWATTNEVTGLDCSNSALNSLDGLEILGNLESLDLSGNPDLLCSELDDLEAAMPNTSIVRPLSCNTGIAQPQAHVENLHNAQGQRVAKTVNGDTNSTVHFIYDQSGQLIAEMDADTGQTLREYVYVNGQQIALVDDTGSPDEAVYYVHNDHLGTPQKISDDSQVVVWDAVYHPFGEVEIVTNVVENNVRFPGQYADLESGLHYNYYRDYDPSIGRYVESDPIGLRGGLNTFGYAGAQPITYVDPKGTVMWRGQFKQYGASFFFGAQVFIFSLESDCINGMKANANVWAVGPSFGLGFSGSPIDHSASKIRLDDGLQQLNAYALNGAFVAYQAGATLAPINAGVGIYNVGRANNPDLVGWGVGLNISIGITITGGSSTVINSSISVCQECEY